MTKKNQPPQSNNPLEDLLGGLLGGQGGNLGSILGSILGGNAPQPDSGSTTMPGTDTPIPSGDPGQMAGALPDILATILNGGSLDSIITPLIGGLVERMGLPPQIAQAIVSIVLNQLMSGMQGGATSLSTSQSSAQPGQGLNLDSLLERMTSGQGVDQAYLHSTGVPQQIAEQTGLDPNTAAESVQHILGMLGATTSQVADSNSQEPPNQAQPDQDKGLDNLLKKW